jgi:diguanylate cyclase (GGDEF)-like protein
MQRISALFKDTRLRLRGAYFLVLLLGLVFSGLVFFYTAEVLNSTRRLSETQLPLLDRIAGLKLGVMREEAVLHDYYVGQDQVRFEREFEEAHLRSLALLLEIQKHYGNRPPIPALTTAHAELKQLAQEVRRIVAKEPVSDSHAFTLLWQVANVSRDIHADLDQLSGQVQAQMHSGTARTADTVRRMAVLGVMFSLGIFVIAVLVGRYIDMYLRESAERRRLAVFAERNPNPVMRLSLAGDVIYANTAAYDLAHSMGAVTTRVLLPPNLRDRLTTLREGSERYQVWEYQRGTYAFECGVHFLPDLASYHVYLTDVTARRQSEEKLVHQAYHHPVTGLPNRRMFHQVVEQALKSPEKRDRRGVIFLLDIDRLKVVIDTLGHGVVDDVLREVAERLRVTLQENSELAPGAMLYHFEADLYAVFVPGIVSDQVPTILAEKLGTSGSPLYAAGHEFSVHFSIGAAIYPVDGNDVYTLLKNADAALHRVKRQGGNAFRLYKPEMNASAANWLATESYLRHAIERDELRLHYQPQVDVRRSRIVGLEALLRWQHPDRGLLQPKDFISIAEESGLIDPMGEWALHSACRQTRDWLSRGLRTNVAVNISGRQFHRQDLPRLVNQLLTDTGLPPTCLELEITESVAMQDVERTAGMLHELKAMGVGIAIDDFGTGFSSLAYLRRFPIDKLKIDRSFVQGVGADGTDATIAHAIVSLGHALNLTVCAEGVETRAQLSRLRQSQCDQAQGLLYSEPIPPNQIESMFARGAAPPSLRQH